MEYPEHYCQITRYSLSFYGLWPFQSKWSTRLTRISTLFILLSTMIFQLSTFSTVNNITVNFIIDVISELMPTVGSLGHMYIRIKYMDKLRCLFECIRDDWKLRKTSFETKIMHKYAETSRLFTFYYLIFCIALMMFNMEMFVPDILDIVLPIINESRPRLQPFQLEFFIFEERYPNLTRIYIFIMIIVSSLIFYANSALYVTLTQHVCGMCELLGYQAECLFYDVENDKDATEYDSIRSKNCGNIVIFVQMHYNIIEFIGTIEIYHTIPFLIDVAELIIVLSLALTQVLSIGGDIDRALRSISLATIASIYLFISNYMSQRITNMSSNICEKVYNSTWYNANVSEQKSLLLIMKRRFRPLVLTACRFYVMSLQNFGMLLQTAISYCMFMRQL